MNVFVGERKKKMLKEFEIYWKDLSNDCQERLAKFLDLEANDDNNWEFIPITSICFEIEDPPIETCIQ